MEKNRHFTTIVVGNNPEEILSKYYNYKKTEEPYIVYEFSKREDYKKARVQILKSLASTDKCDPIQKEYFETEADIVDKMETIDFYAGLIDEGNGYEFDQNTGNIISYNNPNGKFDSFRLGKELSMPLVDKEGKEVFQTEKRNIDWFRTHLYNIELYERVWELVMENAEIKSEEERRIYENMHNRTEYFKTFGSKENYAASNTAFWGYAFVDENGWYELEDDMNQFKWVTEFYDKFIKNLPENVTISVYECFRK